MKRTKKTLLLSDIPPCKNYTAGIVLDQLVRFAEPDSLCCFVVLDPALSDATPCADLKMNYASAVKPSEYAYRPFPGKLGTAFSVVREYWTDAITIPALARKIIAFGRREQVQKVWCVLEGQTTIRLARLVAEGLKVPLITEVWDPPDWWLRDRHIDRISTRRILTKYAKALKMSEVCATASIPMAEAFTKKYGIRTVPFLPSLDQSLALPPKTATENGDFRIVVAGQLYASQEWAALVEALNQVKWEVRGRKIRISFLGTNIALHSKVACHFEFLGWHPQKEVLALINQADLAYCPYWFNPVFETESKLSFPSKLTTYLAAGTPVMFHGPEYASPTSFLNNANAGVMCHSLTSEDILRCLDKVIGDPVARNSLAHNGLQAFKNFLTLKHLEQSFADFTK